MAARLQIFGFPLRVEASFLLLVVFYASGGEPVDIVLATSACVLVAILWHELGHAFVARRCGCTPSITLYWRGGLTHSPVAEGRPALTWKEDIAICVAGPLAGFAFGGIVWGFARAWPPSSTVGALVVERLVWVNVVWGALNLLPLQPWDGGQAARALFVRLSPRRGATSADLLTLALGTSLAVTAVVRGWYWAAYLASIGPMQAIVEQRRRRHEAGVSQAWKAWDEGRIEDARRMGDALARRAGDDAMHASALELVIFVALRRCDGAAANAGRDAYPMSLRPSALLSAIIAWDAGDLETARERFGEVQPALFGRLFPPIVEAWLKSEWRERLEAALEPDAVTRLPRRVLAAISERAFYGGDLELSRRASEGLFGVHGAPDDAYNVACALAQLGDVESAMGWLEKAISAGYTDIAHLESDTDLAPLRVGERWVTLLASANASVTTEASASAAGA